MPPPTTLCRIARPALAVVLVFAQAIAAFGFPLMRSKAGAVKACGCTVTCGTTPDCCCTTPLPPPAAAPRCPYCAAEPEPTPACPRCRVEEAAKPPCRYCPTTHTPANPGRENGVTWVAAWKARQCRGEGPGGLLAEVPAVPPVASVDDRPRLVPPAFPPPADTGRTHFATDPSDPPPRS